MKSVELRDATCKIILYAGEKRRSPRLSLRKKIFVAFCIIGVLFVVFMLITSAFCQDNVAYANDSKSEEELKNKLSESVKNLIDRLSCADMDSFIASLSKEQKSALDITGFKQALSELVNGSGKSFFSKFLSALANSLAGYFLGYLPSFVTVIVICLLNSLLGGLTSDFMHGSAKEVVHTVCYSAIIIVLMSGVISVIADVKGLIEALSKLSDAIFPVLVTLTSMLTGATTVAAYSPYMAAMSAVIIKLISAAVLPAFIAAIVFSVVGSVSKNVQLDRLVTLVRSSAGWLIGIVFDLPHRAGHCGRGGGQVRL